MNINSDYKVTFSIEPADNEGELSGWWNGYSHYAQGKGDTLRTAFTDALISLFEQTDMDFREDEQPYIAMLEQLRASVNERVSEVVASRGYTKDPLDVLITDAHGEGFLFFVHVQANLGKAGAQ